MFPLVLVAAAFIPAPSGAQDTPKDTVCYLLRDRIKAAANDTAAVREARGAYRGCAERVDSVRRATALQMAAPTLRMLGELPWMIPEYHDEQRLSDGGVGFGPMVYAFASPFLDNFSRPEQFAAHGAPGVLVAIVVMERLPGEPIPATYTALDIQDGVNCYWLLPTIPTGPGSVTWSASVTHPAAGTPCVRTATPTPLSARATSGLVFPDRTDFPGVARFSEALDGQPLVGVKCLNAWCEIGPNGGFAVKAPQNGLARKEGRIKGWHDEQWLTENVGGVFKRAVRASVVPRPNIDRLDEADFASGFQWVATIFLHGDPAGTKYASWGLRQGQNRLHLRKLPTGAWMAQIENSAGTRDWPHVVPHPHYDAAVPGTARFRWTVMDDGVWTPCGQQCCKVDGEM